MKATGGAAAVAGLAGGGLIAGAGTPAQDKEGIKDSPEIMYQDTIKAGKAVVLATGGFGYDIPFRTVQDPRLTADVDCTNQPGATAEGLIEVLRLGATPVQISPING